jgi:hypothetical protein
LIVASTAALTGGEWLHKEALFARDAKTGYYCAQSAKGECIIHNVDLIGSIDRR